MWTCLDHSLSHDLFAVELSKGDGERWHTRMTLSLDFVYIPSGEYLREGDAAMPREAQRILKYLWLH